MWVWWLWLLVVCQHFTNNFSVLNRFFALLLLSLHASWWGFSSCAAVITVEVLASPGIMISRCILKKRKALVAPLQLIPDECSCSLPASPVLPMKSPLLMSKQVTQLLLVLNFRFFSVRKYSCCSRKWWYKTPACNARSSQSNLFSPLSVREMPLSFFSVIKDKVITTECTLECKTFPFWFYFHLETEGFTFNHFLGYFTWGSHSMEQ